MKLPYLRVEKLILSFFLSLIFSIVVFIGSLGIINSHARPFLRYVSNSFTSPDYYSHKELLNTYIKLIGAQYDISPELILAIIAVESNFDSKATSPRGAMGLMQLMPATAKRYEVDNPYHPYKNITGGVKYLRYLLDLFDGNVRLAIAAYNAGPGNVSKYKGIPPYGETVRYVKKVMKLYNKA